ncbi:zinc ABC transporter substrate-binding protein [Paracoccus sp. (in: a-proteobacteria)]|uniref:zinc ABC transporter substrate-binding protein n=1 Tax=Paracoccus sp. TaxID=267 RepID=UPI0026DF20E4|nr:zinc ABC transporter substrate-binding protein [Paracoccus sp. (in: a-proteobacteria)]MDO5647838.1 zinc ABC transporter substrate-binding protein [Paracoccus sp. (in: a-proteobacteria)]
MNRILTAALLSLTAAPVCAAPNVVADIPAIGSLAQQVMGDLGQVRVLLPDGASAHHYQMRPSDAAALQSAGLLVWVGPDLTPWLTRAAGNLGAGVAQVELLRVDGTHLQDYGDGAAHDHGDHDDHGHDHDHDDHAHDDHDHSHDGTDPHAWLDPANAVIWLGAIADALAEQDAENAATYRANADAAAAQITALDAELKAQLTPLADHSFVVFHDAYGYFTGHYGLQPALSVTLGDASTPSAARLASIRATIQDTGATCAFPEYNHDDALVKTVIEGTGARLGGKLAPEGTNVDLGADQYAALLRNLADTLTDCLAAD